MGLPSNIIKKIQNQLIPKPCDYFNQIGEEEEMRHESLLAHITIIPKSGKDKTLCSSYRPLALLNTDTKLYAKLRTSRISDIIPHLVHPDQVGFVNGRQAGIRQHPPVY